MVRIFLILTISFLNLFSCQQKNDNENLKVAEENNFSEYISPVKLDSLLDEEFLLNKYYVEDNMQKQFNFLKPIASAKIFKHLIDADENESDPDYPKELISEIYFTKKGKLSSFELADHSKKLTVIYDSKNFISHRVQFDKDYYGEGEAENITEYKYDYIGNLKSKYQYKVTQKGLEFSKYTEYKYSLEKEKIVVDEMILDKSVTFNFNTNKYYFDQKKRLIFKTSNSRYLMAGNKMIAMEKTYFYENNNFPEKITRVEYNAATDYSKKTEKFSYDKEGRFTEYLLICRPKITMTQEKYNHLSTNKVEKISEFKVLKKYQMMDLELDEEPIKEHHVFTFDTFRNITLDVNMSIPAEKNYIENTYKFDKLNNWVEKAIKEHFYIPAEHQDEDVNEDFYHKFRRDINYLDFKAYSSKIIDTKAREDLLKKILLQEQFYEKFK